MRKLVVMENLSLDGVMQAPGRPGEDTRGGFAHGGWAPPYNDQVMGKMMGAGMATVGPLLFGRRTYEDFHSVWPKRTESPFSSILDNADKYVTSRTLTEPLPWQNSTLLAGDASETVPQLKKQAAKDILVMGSGELVRSLFHHNLVDVYKLLIHPLVLGSGRRLFAEAGAFGRLQLVDSVTTTTGVIIATYQPAE
jgi:dihydrofolate reductase